MEAGSPGDDIVTGLPGTRRGMTLNARLIHVRRGTASAAMHITTRMYSTTPAAPRPVHPARRLRGTDRGVIGGVP